MKMWRQWRKKTKQIIRSQKGETLMESIISILIFLLLMLAVTTMIQTSLKMTGISIRDADEMQKNINRVALSDYSGDPEKPETAPKEANITFTAADLDIDAKHKVSLNKSGGLLAFAPIP